MANHSVVNPAKKADKFTAGKQGSSKEEHQLTAVPTTELLQILRPQRPTNSQMQNSRLFSEKDSESTDR